MLLFRFPSFSNSILASIQNDSGRQGVIMRKASVVILNECEGSITVVRKTVRCHPSDRFFTLCHCPVFRLSHTTFLPPFRMTIGGKGVIMRKASVVILNECEGSITVVRKTVRCHPSNRFFTLCYYSASLPSHMAFLPPLWMTGDVKRHPERTWRICCRNLLENN